MPKNLRKTLKRRKTLKKIRGGDCSGDCDKNAQGYFAGGGKRRKRRLRKSRKLRKSIKSRKSIKRVRGGAFQGYSMWTNAGPLESSGVGLTKSVLTASTHEGGNPLDQPIEFKYGYHNTPKV